MPTDLKLVVDTSCEQDDNAGLDYAVVHLSIDFCRTLIARIERVAAETADGGDLYTMQFWGGPVTWHGEDAVSGTMAGTPDLLSGEAEALGVPTGYAMLAAPPAWPEAVQATELLMTEVSRDWARFSCVPKHGDITVTSRPVPLAAWRAALDVLTDGR